MAGWWKNVPCVEGLRSRGGRRSRLVGSSVSRARQAGQLTQPVEGPARHDAPDDEEHEAAEVEEPRELETEDECRNEQEGQDSACHADIRGAPSESRVAQHGIAHEDDRGELDERRDQRWDVR